MLFRSRTGIVLIAASVGWRAGSRVGGVDVDSPSNAAAGCAGSAGAGIVGAEASGSGATAAGTALRADGARAAGGCAGGALLGVARQLFGHGVQAGGDGDERA
jgi:hypothetical protein